MSFEPRQVRVECPARLHLGFVDLHGGIGRRFGSLGLALEDLSTVVSVSPATTLTVTGPDAHRAAAYAKAACAAFNLEERLAITIERAIPAHAGLGSGTQLALAVASAVAAAHGITHDTRSLAALTGRGKRSGIGIGVFESGGFVIDGGLARGTTVPPLLARFDCPPAWRMVLVCDEAHEGLSGNAERTAFATLAPMDSRTAGELCRQTLMGVFPALVEQDFPAFCRAIDVIQDTIGDYFAPHQGGRYTSTAVAAVIADARAGHGVTGTGQTSWGPTGFMFVANEATARALLADLEERYRDTPTLSFSLHRPRNHGAVIEHATTTRLRASASA